MPGSITTSPVVSNVSQTLRVRKRDGRTIQDWDTTKLERAITKSFNDVSVEINGEFAHMVKAIHDEAFIGAGDGTIDVESVQNIVKRKLMDYGFHSVAEAYIVYAHKRAELRKNRSKPDLKVVQDFIHLTRYAKYRYEWKRREQYPETVDRSKGMHKARYPAITEAIEWAYNRVYERIVLPSMRSMQFGGEAQLAHHAKGYNCAFSVCNRLRFFSEAFYLLLCGTGVGYSVQYRHTEQIPELGWVDKSKVKHIVVKDNIEGWADAAHEMFMSFVHGYYVEYAYHEIRPQNSRLKTSGGRAPGHIPLRESLERLRALLIDAQGRRLEPIECYDAMCILADAVYSGGIREAATICLFDIDDPFMMHAKIGDWHKTHPWRARSNNSVVLVRGEVKKEQFKRIFKATKQWGEPGFFFCDDPDTGANPCVEIGLNPKLTVTPTIKRDIEKWAKKTNRKVPAIKPDEVYWGWQMCVGGDTKLITRTGITTIKDAVDKSIEVWNGSKWCNVSPFITGYGRKLYRVHFSDGSSLDVTDNHKFLVADRFSDDYQEVMTKDLMSVSRHKIHVPRQGVIYDDGIKEPAAYDYGFFLADGYLHNHAGHIQAEATLFGKKIGLVGKLGGHTFGGDTDPVNGVKFLFDYVDIDLATTLKGKDALPSILFTWDRYSILNFVAGWADGDGSKTKNGCRIYGTEGRIRDLQLLLTKAGVVASVNKAYDAGGIAILPGGRQTIRNKAIWYVQVAGNLPTLRFCTDGNVSNKNKWQIIESIEEIPGLHATYCLEEPENHTCLFNNVITKQCNLTEVNCAAVKGKDEFMDAVKAATIIGTAQAGYTDFPYLGWVSEYICSREALLGVSLTGIMDNPDIALNPAIQREAAQLAVETNIEIAEKIGINPAARVTCIKPSGTASLVVGAVGSGIHAHHARRYFRRIRANPQDPVYKLFKKHNPHMCITISPTKELIIFPVMAPDGAIVRKDLSAEQFLDKVLSTMQNWVVPGNARPNSSPGVSHNVSNTITVKADEWDDVAEIIWKHRKYFTGVSLLAEFGDKEYQHAPREEVINDKDEAIWQHLIAEYKPIDWLELKEEDDNTEMAGEVACSGGACQLKY